jgi:hypothetical protein
MLFREAIPKHVKVVLEILRGELLAGQYPSFFMRMFCVATKAGVLWIAFLLVVCRAVVRQP